MYTSNSGDIEVATVVRAHFDDDPPYYTIRLERSSIEKQTDSCNLTSLFEGESDGESKEEVLEDDKRRCPLTTMQPLFVAMYSAILTNFPPQLTWGSGLVFVLGISHYIVPNLCQWGTRSCSRHKKMWNSR